MRPELFTVVNMTRIWVLYDITTYNLVNRY
jgi:hypothetical protein